MPEALGAAVTPAEASGGVLTRSLSERSYGPLWARVATSCGRRL